jgi:hypothetical protein
MLSIKNAAEPRQSWTVAHGILSAVPNYRGKYLSRRGDDNWQGIGPMWRDASFAIIGFLLGVTAAFWTLILVAAR